MMVLLILLCPGALFFECCKANFTSASVMGSESGLSESVSVLVCMCVEGVMRCEFACKCAVTVSSVAWSNCAFSCCEI